jgi:hypothetical protein
VVLDPERESSLVGIGRHPFGHSLGEQDAAALEPEVEVVTRRVVLLYDEAGQQPPPFPQADSSFRVVGKVLGCSIA